MLIDLCLDSEESCKDVRHENDLNNSRKKQKRIERKHQDDLQGGFQSRLTSGYVNSRSGRIPFLRTTSAFSPAMTAPPIINIGNGSKFAKNC